jgi:WhiB family transcriptional regulator, redox-sensing transcriptional regulator
LLLADLLTDLAQGTIPHLNGARCRSHAGLFDQTIAGEPGDWFGDDLRYARKAAQAVCASCPVLAQCDAWVQSLPRRQRPLGIVGGRYTDPDGRRWDKAAPRRRDSPGRFSA